VKLKPSSRSRAKSRSTTKSTPKPSPKPKIKAKVKLAYIGSAIQQILGAFQEGFEGPPPNWGYFSDRGPDAGFLATLAKMSAAEASRMTGGTSIAGHVYHLVFSLEASAAYIKGDHSPRKWEESWSVKAVDDAAWAKLRDQLRAGYEATKKIIASHATDGVASLGISIGAATHVAYHLGAVRQKMAIGK
jgi:hypothetical protein